MIRFRCQQCREELEVEEAHAGQAATCRLCGANVVVPGLGVAEAVANFVPPTPPPPSAGPESFRWTRWTTAKLVFFLVFAGLGFLLFILAGLAVVVCIVIAWVTIFRSCANL